MIKTNSHLSRSRSNDTTRVCIILIDKLIRTLLFIWNQLIRTIMISKLVELKILECFRFQIRILWIMIIFFLVGLKSHLSGEIRVWIGNSFQLWRQNWKLLGIHKLWWPNWKSSLYFFACDIQKTEMALSTNSMQVYGKFGYFFSSSFNFKSISLSKLFGTRLRSVAGADCCILRVHGALH